MAATLWSALWFLPVALPICVWVTFSDLSRMKIPNIAVIALFAAYLIVGPIALPFDAYLWRIAVAAIILVIGFVIYQFGGIGAGDIKFIAAMSPFFDGDDLSIILFLSAATLLGAAATHRIARRIPAVRRATPGWVSWDHKKFPMGLALSGILIFYLLLALFYGQR